MDSPIEATVDRLRTRIIEAMAGAPWFAWLSRPDRRRWAKSTLATLAELDSPIDHDTRVWIKAVASGGRP